MPSIQEIYFKKPMSKLLLNTKGAIFLIILFYLSLAMFNINSPGLNTDEAFHGVASNNIFKDASDIVRGRAPFSGCYIILFRKIFPIMPSDYYGAVIAYLFYPFIRILGSNVISLRFGSIFIFAIFLLSVYQLCKIWFGKRVGLLAALLTATNLAFVQYSRVGLYRCEIIVMFFFWVGLFFLIKYSQKEKYSFLCLSFFFFGLGLSTKISFLYYIVALTLAYSTIGKRLNLLGSFNIKKAIIMLLSFCLGSFFIIVYNIKKPWITIKQLLSVLIDPNGTGRYTVGRGVNNWDYLNNLGMRLKDLFTLLKGDISGPFYWNIFGNSIIEIAFSLMAALVIISLVSLLFLALFSPNLSKIIRYRILFLYVIYAAVFFLSPFTLSGFNQGHLLVLLPFPQVAIALFLSYIWRKDEQRKIVFIRIFGWFLIISILLFNIWMNIYFNVQMKKTGGYGRWSTAIYELADYLQENNITTPVMFGYGLHSNLMFLTDNKVTPIIYDKFFPQPIISAYKQLFSDNEQLFYLTLTPDDDELEDFFASENLSGKDPGLGKVALMKFFKQFSRDQSKFHRDLFMKFIQESGRKKELYKIFMNNAGLPAYWLYKIY